jgi:hypothetical protein
MRQAGRTTRGLDNEHYRLVAEQYRALVANGERSPVKAIAEMNHVTISAASGWIAGARGRKHLEPKETT